MATGDNQGGEPWFRRYHPCSAGVDRHSRPVGDRQAPVDDGPAPVLAPVAPDQIASAPTTARTRSGAWSSASCTSPNVISTAGIRVSRSTGNRIPATTGVQVGTLGGALGADRLGEQPPAGRLELRNGVVVHGGARLRAGLEADVHVGREPVRRRCLGRRVGLVGGGHGGTALAQCLHELARERARAHRTGPPRRAARPARARLPSALSSSRTADTPGPVPVWRASTCSAFTVSGPHTPSTYRPELRWKSSSARVVPGPKIPSTRPQSNPIRASMACSSLTSSPRRFGATSTSSRSPSRHVASTIAFQVSSSQTPVSRRPRWRWNVRNASSVDAQNKPASAPAGGNPAAPRRRCRSRMASPR